MTTYGLIGYPLTHSFSAAFFSAMFERELIDAEYINFEIEDILDIREVIIFNQHLKGLNVTIPYKEQVIPFLDELSDTAAKIGAVNTIKITRRPNDMYYYHLKGYNTDYIGFRSTIAPLISADKHKSALILGTGGASKAVFHALNDMNIECRFVSRTPADGVLTYAELTPETVSENKIIVNASPIGTFPNADNCPDIPYNNITPDHLLYDLVYNPAETLFMKKGRAQGATAINGAAMLESQALAAWEIWTKE